MSCDEENFKFDLDSVTQINLTGQEFYSLKVKSTLDFTNVKIYY